MGEPMRLGAHLRYPITITRLLAKPGDTLKKGASIMEYSFRWVKEVGDPVTGDTWEEEQTTISTWASPAEGTLKRWSIKVGEVIQRDQHCVVIEEPCKHPIQVSGLCGICGKDMTEIDWSTDRADTERAPINMTHDQVGLTVSREQATRVELELQRRLLEQRKLSLVVDLDQTIIHACIDPTVGEWQKDPNNPNHEAVKDVQSFQLNDDGPRGVASGCFYYIKMRPGLRSFLEHVSQLYELHVYTMGTRAYAKEIAKIVDPDQKLFGNRVISRDENGNMTAKSLQRLFPVSTNMVVIIDDRADVWPKNRPNLIKVVPYDFFKGVGDINSSFLPKRDDQFPPTDKPAPNGAANSTNGTTEGDAKVSALEGLAGMSSGDDVALLKLQTEEQERALEKQLKEKPLRHMQEQLDKEDEAAEQTGQENESPDSEHLTPPHQRHQVLQDDDKELHYLEQHLKTIHSRYYEAYSLRTDRDEIPDVGEVLDDLKSAVLRGTNIVLSGLVPLGIDVYRSEIGLQAMSYGAELRTRIGNDISHLVISSSRPRTQKVRQAAKISSIKIVNQNWLQNSISQWEELDETPYLVDVHPADRGGAPLAPLLMPGDGTSAAVGVPEQIQNGREDEEPESGEDEEVEANNESQSPIDDLKDFDFGKVDEELEEFLASDSDDSKAENDDEYKPTDELDSESGRSDTGSEKENGRDRTLKRRGMNGIRGGSSSGSKRKLGEATESDSDKAGSGSGSALAKKLRISRSRGGSSLRSAYTAEVKSQNAESQSQSQSQPQPQPRPIPSVTVNGGAVGGDEDDEVVLLKSDAGTNDGEDEDGNGDRNGDGDGDEFGDDIEADLMAELDREEQEAVAEKG